MNMLNNLKNNSKFIINVLLILAQLIIFGFLLYRFNERALAAYWVVEAVAILVVLRIVYLNKSASFKISWIIFVLILPVVGIVLYLLWGESRISEKSQMRLKIIDTNTVGKLEQNQEVYHQITDLGIKKQVDLITHLGDTPVWNNTRTAYLKLGEIMHQENLKIISQAEKFIFLEYFIITAGKMYDEMMAALIAKAEAGVEVRLLFDAGGSMTTMPKDFMKTCADHKIHCAPFNPLSASLYRFISFRDHRKMTIVDGNVAIAGGINIGDEYINEIEVHGHWKDMALRLEGDAVYSMTAMFLGMWDYVTREQTNLEAYRGTKASPRTDELVMPFCDGPMNSREPIENTYMNLFTNAKRYVYITTPYLILDTDLTTCILMAARSGVDVRIITPGIPDQKIVYATTRSFYGTLLAEGVRIYEYTPGFLHGKVLVTDDQVAVVGSINMDYRSLTWNYEYGTWIHQSDTVMEIKEDLLGIIGVSHEVLYADWKKSSLLKKVGQSILRITAPLM